MRLFEVPSYEGAVTLAVDAVLYIRDVYPGEPWIDPKPLSVAVLQGNVPLPLHTSRVAAQEAWVRASL